MKTIDITIDFETCGLDPNSAVLQLAAVVWDRHLPLKDKEKWSSSEDYLYSFDFNIDLRSCVAAGMTFDQATIDWWAKQSDEAKASVLDGDCYPVKDVMENFLQWIADVKAMTKCDAVCLWAQGSDFDMGILRSLAKTFGMKERLAKLVPYTYFRDARTYILEMGAAAFCDATPFVDASSLPAYEIYKRLPKLEAVDGVPHNALYDCIRTSWNVWNIMCKLEDDQRAMLDHITDLSDKFCNVSKEYAALEKQYNELKGAYDLMQNNKTDD